MIIITFILAFLGLSLGCAFAQEVETVLVLEQVETTPNAGNYRISDRRVFRRPSGDGFLVSYANYPSGGHPATWHITAFDALGKVDWQYLRDTGFGSDAVAELSSGEFAAVTSGDFALERLNASGEFRWRVPLFLTQHTSPSPDEFRRPHILELSDGSLLALATKFHQVVNSSPYVTNVINHEIAAARLASSRQFVFWKDFFGGTEADEARVAAELPENSIAIGGISSSPQGEAKDSPHYGKGDIWLVKLSFDGSRVWDRSFGGDQWEDLHAVKTNKAGLVLFGLTKSGATGNKSSPALGFTDIWVVQTDHSGVIVRDHTFGTEGGDELVEVFPLPDGGWVLSARHWIGFRRASLLICLNEDLSERWRFTLGQGAVTTTQAGEVRWMGVDSTESWKFRQVLISPQGAVLTDQILPQSPPPLPGGEHAEFVTETREGRYLSTDVDHVNVFRPIIQPRGTPMFSVEHLYWADGSPNRVAILSTFTNATIFYTTNGTPASHQSLRYTGPFDLLESAHVHALAYSPDFAASATNSIFVPGREVETHSLTVTAGPGGAVQFDGVLWYGHGEASATETIAHPAPGTFELVNNRPASLKAIPSAGAQFVGWEGDLWSTNETIELLGNDDLHVRAVFGATLQTSPSDGGMILVNGLPGPRLTPLGSVRLQAAPNDGFYFASWGANASGSENPLPFAFLSTNQFVSALFLPLSATEAAPVVLAFGPGSVTASPSKQVYQVGEELRLNAVPALGAAFLGWVGATNSTEPQIALRAGAQELHALFAGVTTNGFSAAFPVASSDHVIFSSTNLVDWQPVQTGGAYKNILLLEEPIDGSSDRRFYRVAPR